MTGKSRIRDWYDAPHYELRNPPPTPPDGEWLDAALARRIRNMRGPTMTYFQARAAYEAAMAKKATPPGRTTAAAWFGFLALVVAWAVALLIVAATPH